MLRLQRKFKPAMRLIEAPKTGEIIAVTDYIASDWIRNELVKEAKCPKCKTPLVHKWMRVTCPQCGWRKWGKIRREEL